MAKVGVKEKVTELVKPIIENLGYELVEVDYTKEHSGMVLNIVIYKKDGISIDDCEKVSRAIDQPLDDLNPTNDVSYTLNVSSPGLDRPIKTCDDARRNLGNKIEVKLFSAKNGKKIWVGELKNYNETSIEIETENGPMAFEFDEIALASPVIEF